MLKSLLRTIAAFLYPDTCLACGAVFQPDTHNPPYQRPIEPWAEIDALAFQRLAAPYLCPACNTGFTPVSTPTCIICGTPFSIDSGGDHACEACLRNPPMFKTARSAGMYDDGLMALIHSLKYNRNIQAAKPLGRLLFSALVRFFSDHDIDVAVPVPLHPRRFRARGFNQAYLLMRRWPDRDAPGYPAGANVPIDKTLLERSRNTTPQTGLDRNNRLTNIRDAFSLKNPSRAAGKRILVVDDVMTTGATVNECARVLLAAGAAEVNVLTLARTRSNHSGGI